MEEGIETKELFLIQLGYRAGYEKGKQAEYDLSEETTYQEILNLWLKSQEKEEFEKVLSRYNLSEKDILSLFVEKDKKDGKEKASCFSCAFCTWNGIWGKTCSNDLAPSRPYPMDGCLAFQERKLDESCS